jgi:hypothetical protein
MSVSVFFAQSSRDIANVYVKRAEASFGNLELERSLQDFNKALKHMDSITQPNVAQLGTQIHAQLENFKDAQKYAKIYFLLASKRSRKTEEYTQFLDLYITINEELEKQLEEEKRLEEERIAKEKELQRIDSLKTSWTNKSESLSLKIDSLYVFNRNNLGLYEIDGSFGLIDDKGVVVLEANDYKHAKSFDAYIVFSDKITEPTKVYVYNANTKKGFLLPGVSEFNPLSTHYGKVMLPRGNGRLILYPNNSLKAMVYDLEKKKMVVVANQKELFKSLRKTDKIDKSNKEGQVRINKEWYNFGGHVGGGIYPLFNTDYSIYGYLCSIDGKVLKSSKYNYLGAFYNNKSEAIEDGEVVWLNQNGTKVSKPSDESGVYKGDTKVVKLENGNYQLFRNEMIILGDEKLSKLPVFLRENGKK